MIVLRAILRGAAWMIGIYLGIVLLFVLYFALAAYLPILARKVRCLLHGRGPDAAG